ncbi:hypothetical protein ACH347_14875 [Saccharopolyspora sp. 5N102]|uniref:hypothetical protein n=1 Tax=Saccharopolyspora sp. 5N102 TaxID=3375155 RepID=UPI0037AA7E7F
MRDALHGLDGTQPLPPLPVRPDALFGMAAVPQQRTAPPQPWAPPSTAEDVRRPIRRRRAPAASPQTPRLEPPGERRRRTPGAVVGFLIALAVAVLVALAVLRQVLEAFSG